MPPFTLLLGILVLGFVFAGFLFGAVHTLGSLIGLIFGLLVAGNFSDDLAPAVRTVLGGDLATTRLILFVIIFVLVTRLIGYVVALATKGARILRFIPIVSSLDRLIGAGLGLVEAVLVLGTILLVAAQFPLPPYLANGIEQSWLADILMWGAKILAPLFPGDLRSLQGT